MEIHEDNNLFSGTPEGEEKITESVYSDKSAGITGAQTIPVQPVQEKPSPGTRVIYEAPEKGNKREYTGFTTEKFQSENPFVSQNDGNKEKNENTRTGGQAFEQRLKEKNAYPKKRPSPEIVTQEKKIDEKEILRRRYIEYKKSGNLPKAEDVALDDVDPMEVEEILVDLPKLKKKTSTSEIVRRCVLAVSLVAMVISVGVLLHQYIQYRENQQLTNDLNELIITEPPSTEKSDNDKEPVSEESTTKPLTVEEQWALLKSENPDVVFPAGIQLKYAKFYAINQDFVGYISIDELGVALPVLQSEEKEYYLRRNIYKKNSKYGCPFVPAENDMVSLDRNTVIYGHNMSDGSIFAPLNKYKSLSGFKSAPVIQFDTIYGTYKWKIIAAFITNADKEDDNGYVFPYNFTKLENGNDFMKYIELLKERSLYDTGVDVISSDKILTLSTCAYNFDSARFVVVARMVRPGESAEVDTSMAKENKEPHYPQAWYGKKKKDKKKNPYLDAEKWYYYGE